jgi:hypothetical protein
VPWMPWFASNGRGKWAARHNLTLRACACVIFVRRGNLLPTGRISSHNAHTQNAYTGAA